MTFPLINYKYNGNDEAKMLAEVIDQKFAALEKFLPASGAVSCEVEFEKVTVQNQGRIYRIEATVSINGTVYRAEATEESFEKAIDEVRNELDKELRRAKDKQVTKDKAGGRTFKQIVQGWLS